jgi:hypothetical protein
MIRRERIGDATMSETLSIRKALAIVRRPGVMVFVNVPLSLDWPGMCRVSKTKAVDMLKRLAMVDHSAKVEASVSPESIVIGPSFSSLRNGR